MKQIESELQICHAEYLVGNSRVNAALLARPQGVDVRYQIVLEQEGESETCDAGTDIGAARELFLRVVWGGVSICTLFDVAEDYAGTHF